MHIAGTHSANTEINVTSLIDILLVLLIIFMVITPLQPFGLETVLPPPTRSTVVETPGQPLVVRIKANADRTLSYDLNHQSMQFEEVRLRLAETLAIRQNRTVFLAGDTSLNLQQVAEVVGQIRSAGADQIGILTRKDCDAMQC